MHLSGFVSYIVFFFSMAGIYAILALGLNVQWGFTGETNIGVAGFFAIGAYTTAILTSPADSEYLGGFNLPFIAAIVGAIIFCGLIALAVGFLTLNLRGDYLAIATIGIAETLRLYLTNADSVTGGVRGIAGIPQPFANLIPGGNALTFLALILVVLAAVYFAFERLYRSPWVRVLRAVRSNEPATLASGKNVLRFRIEAFVVGSIAMGLAGVLYAAFNRFVSPEAFDPIYGTFLVWVMLIAGGSGNNLGAVSGAVIIWGVWSATDYLTSLLPGAWDTRAAAIRIFLIGLLLEIILILRPQGIFPERPPKMPGSRSDGKTPATAPDNGD
ncbi:branched-chain amino acid ABC transporter permease [Salinispira pacifica]